MITTAIVLPVRYYPLSALLPAFLPAVEKKKKKQKNERKKERRKGEEREVRKGKKWVGAKWVVGKNWKRRSLELSGRARSIFQTTGTKREAWRRGLWNGIRHSIRSRRKKFYYHGSVTSRFTRLPVQRLELSQNRGKHRVHSASNKAGNLRIFHKSNVAERRNCFEISRSMKETHWRSWKLYVRRICA